MAETDTSGIAKNFSKIDISNETCENNDASQNSLEYGLPLKDVYRLAFNFYKEKEGKAVHFSYEDKLQLVAFAQQAHHGPLVEALPKLPPLGTLDVVGKDRRDAWQTLGQLSKEQAQAGFVELLSRKCPLFNAYVEAHRREMKEQERKRQEEENQKQKKLAEQLKKEEEEKYLQEQAQKEEAIKRQIQQALNEQTFDQFRKYAEQQYPGDPEKQGTLIKQLQEQHYIQYMQQLQAAQRDGTLSSGSKKIEASDCEENGNKNNETEELEEEATLVPASMWTRPDIDGFKQLVSKAEGDGVVRVGQGETVTIRVPTHPDASRLFWEFATDHYDIGFGVYFEYGTPNTSQVSVHISESDDEDIDDIDEDIYDDETIHTGDLESGSLTVNGISKPLLTEIVPVYRRDCHMEVYAGSHQYPGEGVYLLKFDNSYSLFRAKRLYYRVYYSH